MSIHLFTIEDHRQSALGHTLLPGIPSALLALPEVRAVKQGAAIELKLPDGESRRTVIKNYCVDIPVDMENPAVLESLPISVIVPEDVAALGIPVGTEVWLLG